MVKKTKSKKVSNKSEKVFNKAGKVLNKSSKAFGYNKKLSNTLLKYAEADKVQGPGRPPKSFKHTSPLSGKPVPAEVYYEHMRQFKRLQQRRVEDMKEQKIRELAKRGIPPSQIQQYEQARLQAQQNQIQNQNQVKNQNPELLRRIALQRQIEQQMRQRQVQNPNQLPNGTVVPRGTRIWKFRRGVVGEDWTAFGRKKVLRGTPESFWN